jgi:ATP-dependent exoDNAse (exonuclease V) beta subunit
MRKKTEQFDPSQDRIKVVTLHVSKGLEFPVVALVGVGHMPAEGEDEREEARLFYVGATRATQRLVIGAEWARVVRWSPIGKRQHLATDGGGGCLVASGRRRWRAILRPDGSLAATRSTGRSAISQQTPRPPFRPWV